MKLRNSSLPIFSRNTLKNKKHQGSKCPIMKKLSFPDFCPYVFVIKGNHVAFLVLGFFFACSAVFSSVDLLLFLCYLSVDLHFVSHLLLFCLIFRIFLFPLFILYIWLVYLRHVLQSLLVSNLFYGIVLQFQCSVKYTFVC